MARMIMINEEQLDKILTETADKLKLADFEGKDARRRPEEMHRAFHYWLHDLVDRIKKE